MLPFFHISRQSLTGKREREESWRIKNTQKIKKTNSNNNLTNERTDCDCTGDGSFVLLFECSIISPSSVEGGTDVSTVLGGVSIISLDGESGEF